MQVSLRPSGLSHADIRSAGILASVRQAFVDKGFDGASMQDLARAAGMSVGNFYRYFPSKAAIIQALIEHDADMVQRDFAAILTSDQPMATLRHVIRMRVQGQDCADDQALWTEIEAASRHSAEIAQAAQRMETEVIGNLLAVFADAKTASAGQRQPQIALHARCRLAVGELHVWEARSAHPPPVTAVQEGLEPLRLVLLQRLQR